MTEVPTDDYRRWQDELQRCALLSARVEMVAPYRLPRQTRDARYYTERGRVLSAVGPEQGIAFLREEALRALAGTASDGPIGRWLRLDALERGNPMGTVMRAALERLDPTIIDVMNAGVEKAVMDGVADMIAERSRADRAKAEAHRRTLSCDWCQDRGGCDESCY